VLNGSVTTIAIDAANNVYAGGYFGDIINNGSTLGDADYVAKWDGSNWSALGSDGSGGGSINKPTSVYIYGLAVGPDAVYVGGHFFDVNNNGVVLPYADFIAAYGVDYIAPQVSSITRGNPDPTGLSQVDFTVTFSEAVSGVDSGDFTLPASGVSGASITNIATVDNIHYTVTVDTGIGNGSLGLNLVDDDSISDGVGNKLGGSGTGNGNLTGEVYSVTKTAPALIFPADGSTEHSLRPLFDWTNFAGAIGYQLQVSKSPVFSTSVLNVTVNGFSNSQYSPTRDLPRNSLLYWRVRAKTSAIQYGPWSSAFSFMNANPPSIPSLLSPASGALLANRTPTLDWSDSTLPAGTVLSFYELQLDDNSDFSSPILDTNVAVSNYTTSTLSSNAKYYWRVRAWNTALDVSAWSAVRNFREAVDEPTLISPVLGVTVGSLKPTFDWSDVNGATGYTIQVSTSSGFGGLAINATIKTPTSNYTATINLLAGKLYFWRVRANGPNGPGLWSATETFSTP
jgi:hypothetical protein